MKKHFFIIALVLFTIGISKSYGQLASRPVTCLTPDALHPIAGNPFTYQIDIPVAPSPGDPWVAGSLKYTWFVTQDVNFIAGNTLTTSRAHASGHFLAVKDSANYNNITSTANSISLTWKSFTYNPLNPIFVVVNVVGDNGVCSPMNMRVFKVEPQNAFTLDLDNLTETGAQHTPAAYGDNFSQCISNIVSAAFNTVSGKVDYDFGSNTLMYEVVAANWSDAWNLKVRLSGIDPKETITVEWDTIKTFITPHKMTGPAVGAGATDLDYTTAVNVPIQSPTLTSIGSAGESIFIRVTLDHTDGTLNYQGLTDETIKLSVDGVTVPISGTGVGDVHYAAGANLPAEACPWVDGFVNDFAIQTVKARPTITNSVTTMPAPGLGEIKP